MLSSQASRTTYIFSVLAPIWNWTPNSGSVTVILVVPSNSTSYQHITLCELMNKTRFANENAHHSLENTISVQL